MQTAASFFTPEGTTASGCSDFYALWVLAQVFVSFLQLMAGSAFSFKLVHFPRFERGSLQFCSGAQRKRPFFGRKHPTPPTTKTKTPQTTKPHHPPQKQHHGSVPLALYSPFVGGDQQPFYRHLFRRGRGD